jgi:hypothetical protein
VAFLQQILTSISSVPIYKWGWQVPSTAKNEHTSETVNSNERLKNISLYTFLIMTCLPHPPPTSVTSICLSAQEQNPHLTIPSWEVLFPAFYRNGRVITVQISVIFTILWKTSNSHTPTYYRSVLVLSSNLCLGILSYLLSLRDSDQNFVHLIIHKIKSHSS